MALEQVAVRPDGYDGSAVRHIFKQHGVAAAESARGQVAVSDADIEAIPDVISDPDGIVLGTVGRSHLPLIGYVKRMNDGSVLYFEEVRSGRGRLAGVSMRKYPAAKDLTSVARMVLPNARSDGGAKTTIIWKPDDFNARGGAESRSMADPETWAFRA